MKKPNKRFTGKLLTVALAVVMCLGMAVPALATGQNGEITGTEANPATAAITKVLKMPEGTTTPNVTFGFNFVKKALNNNTGDADKALMPEISNTQAIEFKVNDQGITVGSFKTATKEVEINLTGVTFPYAGAYTYTLTELQNITAGTINTDKETIAYSQAEYEITFYVSEGASGLYVSAIGTKIMKNEDGTAGSEAKVDPTPGTGGGLGAGGLVFTNSYNKTTGGLDPTVEANQTLAISHVVAGDFADTGKYFEYDVTVTKPVLNGAATTYKAYILNASGAIIDPATNAPGATIQTDTAGKKYFEFAADTLKTIKLKHNEKLVFTDVPVGATYLAVDQGAADYTPTAKITINGVMLPELSALVGQSLSSGNRMIGESANKAAFTNTHKAIPITGLIIDNLPFVMILVIAAAALVIFILVKSHKRRAYAAGN